MGFTTTWCFLKNLKTNELEIIEDKKLIIQKIVKFLIYQNFQINLLKIFGKIKRDEENFSKYDIVVKFLSNKI